MKKLLFILGVACIVFLVSCDEYGGTIIVKNNYSEDKTVTVYSDFSPSVIIFTYKDIYGPKNIIAGGTANFSVKSNTHYGVVWNHNKIDNYKIVEVSKGGTVEINIP